MSHSYSQTLAGRRGRAATACPSACSLSPKDAPPLRFRPGCAVTRSCTTCCRSRRTLTSLAQQARPRRRAPIPRPNPKHNQHAHRTANPVKNHILIPRATQNRNDRRQHQIPARRHSLHPTPHQSAKAKVKAKKLKKRTCLAGTAHRASKMQNLRGRGTALLTGRCDRPQL